MTKQQNDIIKDLRRNAAEMKTALVSRQDMNDMILAWVDTGLAVIRNDQGGYMVGSVLNASAFPASKHVENGKKVAAQHVERRVAVETALDDLYALIASLEMRFS